MSETKSLRDRLSRFVQAKGEMPLVGSQITFAIRTVKEILNGNRKASQKEREREALGS